MKPIQSDMFIEYFKIVQREVYNTAVSKGWWDGEIKGYARNNAEMIALMHSELSEALEALRHPGTPSDHIEQYDLIEEELADVIIRIMDFAEARGLRIAEALICKMEYNTTREYKHGGKSF